jgi:hypothetical protein
VVLPLNIHGQIVFVHGFRHESAEMLSRDLSGTHPAPPVIDSTVCHICDQSLHSIGSKQKSMHFRSVSAEKRSQLTFQRIEGRGQTP